MLVFASIVGFMGPFGTYDHGELAFRIWHWWLLLMGAYLMIRPTVSALRWVAGATMLPISAVVFWGVVIISAPLAVAWRRIGQDQFSELDGYAGLLPFSFLCSITVLGVVYWAEWASRRLSERRAQHAGNQTSRPGGKETGNPPEEAPVPSLYARLSPSFRGPICALQSEDHYVRVHSERENQLLLMRLRDAIAEMGEASGEQVHRSWWVSYDGIARAEPAGRSWTILLKNGIKVPVARDSVSRLQANGMLAQAVPS